jgi:hypothetical protein
MPSLEGLFFTLDFTVGSTIVSKDLDGGRTLTVALEPGDWELEVKGYTDDGKDRLVVQGQSSISITAGISSQVVVDLKPDFSSGGTGTLFYNVSFPESRAFLSLYSLGAQETYRETAISASSAGTLDNLPAGTYQAFIDLYDGTNNQAAVWTGVVHIYDGSTTSLTQIFTAANFTACPPEVGKGEKTLAEKLEDALDSPAGSYTIVLDGTETDLSSFTPKSLNVTDAKNITLTLKGNGQTVSLGPDGDNGSLLTLGAESGTLTLILQDITLQGKDDNNAPLVQVNSGATLEMKAGSLITGNTSSTNGGGVYVSGGALTMSGGAVSGNRTTFSSTGTNGGGGVFINGGQFTMNGGKVSDNTNNSTSVVVRAGGVFITGGTFTMNGGTISGNTASGTGVHGGGVHVTTSGTFTMNGGAISDNTASGSTATDSLGGGVYVSSAGTFTMNNGAISGNNTTNGRGGGVFINGGFTMTGGVIYGSGAGDGKANTANSDSNSGAALYKGSGSTVPDGLNTTDETIGTP